MVSRIVREKSRNTMLDLDDIYLKYAQRYILIGNPKQAALDVGVPADSVNEFLQNTKSHPEVLMLIAQAETEMPDFDDATSVKKWILKALMKEANFRGLGAQQSARITALKAIAELTGIEPAKKIDVNAGIPGGMLLLPVMDAAAWETSAAEMQEDLKKRARE